jgi:hypothetical protein
VWLGQTLELSPPPWVPAALDGLATGVVFLLLAKVGRDLRSHLGASDGWVALAVAASGVGTFLVLLASGLNRLQGAGAPPLWPLLLLLAGVVAAAGGRLVRRHDWSMVNLVLLGAATPIFAGVLGTIEALLLEAARGAAGWTGFLALLIFIPVWLATGFGVYLVGLLGGAVALGRRRHSDAIPGTGYRGGEGEQEEDVV